MMAYQVNVEAFDGPLDLLVSLVARHHVDVYDVPLADVIEGFLAHVDRLDEMDLDAASDFLVLAATLLELKAVGLVPDEKPSEAASELSAYEQDQLLAGRLAEYVKFKNAALALRSRLDAEAKFHRRVAPLEPRFQELLPDFLDGVRLEQLVALMDALAARERVRLIDSTHIATIAINIEDQIDVVLSRLRLTATQSFRELTLGVSRRVEIVATFLAVLELYKRGLVRVSQARTFGEIEVTLESTGV